MLTDLGFIVLRMGVTAILLLSHALPILLSFEQRALDFQWLGLSGKPALLIVLFFELGCASLVFVGLATRLASLACCLYFLTWIPMDSALLYVVTFLAIALLGPGRFCADAMFGWVKR